MSRFIFTSTDSGAGCLKQAQIAGRVLGLGYELVHGPAPLTVKPLDFFAARTALWPAGTEDWEIESTGPEVSVTLMKQADVARTHDAVELWIDPTTNARLQLVQLLDWLRSEPGIGGKLFVAFIDRPLGGQTPEWASGLEPQFVRVGPPMFDAASKCWHAFRQTTPLEWFDLLTADLRLLPLFSMTVRRMLHELPDSQIGLIETERQILQLVSNGTDTPRKLLSHASWFGGASVFDYWQLGRLLTDLANGPKPALSGMNGESFTLELHDDRERLNAFWRSSLGLTGFGQALLDCREDYAQHNPINRWWGGTRLTNQNLWRWNSAIQALIEPT